VTLINQNSTVTHNGNGVTTLWPYTFIIPDADSARVGLFDIASGALTELSDTDYSITGLGDENGGEVTYPLIGAAITSAKRLVIWREVEYTQDTELTNQTPYYPVVLEDQLDRIVMQIQQLAADMGRAITVTLGSDLTPDEFIEDLQQAEAAAEASAAAAAASAASAATQALPDPGTALAYVRRNAGNTAYESRTVTQVRGDISAVGLTGAETVAGAKTFSSNPVLSGGGVQFPAVQVPSADVNTLDDYEEGTFTPVLAFGGSSTGITYAANNRIGRYIKVGKLVTASVVILLSSKGAQTGVAIIDGFPYLSADVLAGMFWSSGEIYTTISGRVNCMMLNNSTYVGVYKDGTQATDADFTNATYMIFTVTYEAAA
jgi:hypothetical protein